MSLSTVGNILKVINLLINKRKVTTKIIIELCGVSRRTAYRYIDVIHRANIPVYYDRKLNEYKLVSDHLPQYGRIGLQETTIISFALVLLSNCTNDDYNAQLKEIVNKILIRQPLAVEESLESQENTIESKLINYDFSEVLTSLIIYTAILSEKSLNVVIKSSSNGPKSVLIKKPKMTFKAKWRVEDMKDGNSDGIMLNEIECAKILNC